MEVSLVSKMEVAEYLLAADKSILGGGAMRLGRACAVVLLVNPEPAKVAARSSFVEGGPALSTATVRYNNVMRARGQWRDSY